MSRTLMKSGPNRVKAISAVGEAGIGFDPLQTPAICPVGGFPSERSPRCDSRPPVSIRYLRPNTTDGVLTFPLSMIYKPGHSACNVMSLATVTQ